GAGFFREFDILLCPVMPTAAFPHDSRPQHERTISIDGRYFPYDAQFHWAGPATLNGLPATAFPVGMTKDGLPVGLQAVGPYLEDRTPLHFAALAEQVFGGIRPPSLQVRDEKLERQAARGQAASGRSEAGRSDAGLAGAGRRHDVLVQG